MVAGTVRLVCSECKHKTSGRDGDQHRQGCPKCGGQLAVIRYRHPRARRR